MDKQYKFIVLDQNVMRDSGALFRALDRCCREDLQLLIPDVAGFELSKGSKQFDTWHRSLECLSSYREFVTVSRKLTKMLEEERRTGYPCESLIDSDLTMLMRQLLDALEHNRTLSLRQMVDGPMQSLMPASLAAWSDSEQHKQWIITIRDQLNDMINSEALKRLRRSPENGLRIREKIT